MRKRWLWLIAVLTACIPEAPPDSPDSDPAVEDGTDAGADGEIVVPDAPWRTELSQAAGHEPREAAPLVFIRNARLLVGDGSEIASGHLLLRDGKIAAVGEGPGEPPDGALVLDARGRVVTPGLVDTHSHLGVYPQPHVKAHMDGNEMVKPVTPGSRTVDAVWVQDPGLQRALQGGTTTIQVLPGSGNLIGGRAVTLKLRPATTARAMHMRGAPDGLKMACGENPKRVYGSRKQPPMTRMGNLALQRQAFLDARRLIHEWTQWREAEQRRLEKWQKAVTKHRRRKASREQRQNRCLEGRASHRQCAKWEEKWLNNPLDAPKPKLAKLPPKRNVNMETLAAALEGRVLVHIHCYRSDDMANMMALADEMGFSIRSFHHALEAYKIRDVLAASKIGVSTWADWWGFKIEAYDGIPQNLAMVALAGAPALLHPA